MRSKEKAKMEMKKEPKESRIMMMKMKSRVTKIRMSLSMKSTIISTRSEKLSQSRNQTCLKISVRMSNSCALRILI